jgi:hypothetical protein
MSDSVIQRLDKFVIDLLDSAEGRCDTPAGNVTSAASEDSPGSSPAAVSITERVAVLKAAVGYLSVRNKLTTEGDGGGEETEEPPEIVRFEQRLKSHRARRR